jgi:hypothetical protein
VPRSGAPRTGGTTSSGGRVGPTSRIIPVSPGPDDRDRAVPGPSPRPRGNRPSAGSAVPRSISNIPDLGWRRDPYWAYGWWQYSRWMPTYYGPWGGYFYYDPYWWSYYHYGYYGPYYGPSYGYYGGYSRRYSDYGYDYGALRLKVKPREAQVYVDGYFAGVVDDYDGIFQKLRLREGGHRIELRAEGYLPSIFEVMIVPGDKITYDQDLRPGEPPGKR